MKKQSPEKLSGLKMDLINIKNILKMVSWLSKSYLPVTIIVAVLDSLFPFINIIMPAYIIDELLGEKRISSLISLVLITIILNLVVYLILNGLRSYKTLLEEYVVKRLDLEQSRKILVMDFEHVEDPRVHELRQKAIEGSRFNGGIYGFVERFETIVKNLMSIGISAGVVAGLFIIKPIQGLDGFKAALNSPVWSPVLAVLIVSSTLLSMLFNSRSGKLSYTLFEKVVPMNRLFTYYNGEVIGDYKNGKDIRLYGMTSMLDKKLLEFHEGALAFFIKISALEAKYAGYISVISSLITGFIYSFVSLKALIGAITIGSIMKYIGSIQKFNEGFSSLLNSFIDLRARCQYMKSYVEFFNLPYVKYRGTLPVEKRNDNEYEIEFRNVSFKYPGGDDYILKNVSIKLKIGERLAVVGMNGAGKTTFIKLLCRLYDPTEGIILLNGIDIKKYEYNEYLKLFSVVFQDFKLFAFSVEQNAAASVEADSDKVMECLDEAGIGDRVREMPRGMYTHLYKNFQEDGVEISGGEGQKIAIARALYKDAPFIILDEPTSALDPIAEFEIYSKFDKLVGSKTAIYISHRLSSCRFCHDIAVFHQGCIIERGSHDELLKNREGKYYELWHAQAQYYTEQEQTACTI